MKPTTNNTQFDFSNFSLSASPFQNGKAKLYAFDKFQTLFPIGKIEKINETEITIEIDNIEIACEIAISKFQTSTSREKTLRILENAICKSQTIFEFRHLFENFQSTKIKHTISEISKIIRKNPSIQNFSQIS